MTREHLLNSVCKTLFDKKKTVNVAIKRLKAKIDPKGDKEYIRSIRGEGYIFAKNTSTFYKNLYLYIFSYFSNFNNNHLFLVKKYLLGLIEKNLLQNIETLSIVLKIKMT